MRHILAAFFSFFFALFSSPNAGHVDSITLNKTDITLSPGQSETLVATLKPDGVRALVQWSSTDPKVASVDQNGKVTAVAPGTATINVKARTQKTSCTVTVAEPAPAAVAPEAEPGPVVAPDNAIDMGVIITRKDGTRFKLYWGNMNLGANSPLEAGEYYAWGETEPKVSYGWKNYKWNDGKGSLLKYSKEDGLAQLDPEDDVAAVRLGGRWRMPTIDEWKALKEQCDWVFSDGSATGGVKGWIVISRKSDNSIFLPAGGFFGPELYSLNELGFYQSSSIWPDGVGKCSSLRFIDEKAFVAGDERGTGLTVRPVWVGEDTDERPVYKLEDATQQGDDLGIDIIEVEPTPTEEVVTNPNVGAEAGQAVKEAVELGMVDLGVVITRNDGTRYKLLVAECNLGAASPEQTGNFYAWGEITPNKPEGYSRGTYKFVVDNNTYKKYCTSEEFERWDKGTAPTPDNKAVLDPEDDAVQVSVGGTWRIPYKEEMMAVKEQCTWIWTTRNGVPGYIIASKAKGNNSTVFLPAAGQRMNDKTNKASETGFYSFANLSNGFDEPDKGLRHVRVFSAEILRFDSESIAFEEDYREYGYTIRPVAIVELDPVVDKSKFIPGAVDLGVVVGRPDRTSYKLYWADCNLGAVRPAGLGDYYAWGDTEPNYQSSLPLIWKPTPSFKSRPGYTSDAYKWASHNGGYSKYDRALTLELADDAAHAALGGGWRMPDKYEWEALMSQCTWEWTEKEGVAGYKVTGSNGNSIFLPAAGYYEARQNKHIGMFGRYMMPALSARDGQSGICNYFFIDEDDRAFYYDWRHMGYSIRPVTEIEP